MVHGYGAYTHGCRCDTCRKAKAEYMRVRRASTRRPRQLVNARPSHGRNYVEGITHGYAGYQDYSCRCEVCKAAKTARSYAQREPHRAAMRAARDRGERYVAPGIEHGARVGYQHYFCRCFPCTAANYEYNRRHLTPAPGAATEDRREADGGPSAVALPSPRSVP